MLALVLKLTLAPALVATATRVARRLGHRAGGLVGGLPVVAAPIVLIYAVEQGDDFARPAAAAGVLGIISLVGFCVAYALVARGHGLVAALAAGWLAFGAGTAVLSPVSPPLAVSVGLTLSAIVGGSVLLRILAPEVPVATPGGDLLAWRLGITATLVLALTAAANGLSAHLAGLLAPFPIITAVLAGFTQARAGGAAAIELLGGLATALVCFLAFFATLAALLDRLGGPAAFGLATVAALSAWGLLVVLVERRGT